jgi:outer membrane protein TolC
MKIKKYFFEVLFANLLVSTTAGALTLEEYLQQVREKNKTFQALKASQEAASVRYRQGDLELSPFLSASANYLDDKAQQFSGAGFLTHNQVRQYSLGLSKKFSTGTQASLTTSVQSLNIEGNSGPASFAFENHSGTLGVTVSQSLWKDFFGRSTRLRWQREASQELGERQGYNLESKQALIRAETIYWDALYLQKELEIRKDSLERSRKIEDWVRRRAANGIGDRADVLNAQGLVATRELQLLVTQDELKAAQKLLMDQIELPSEQILPKLSGSLEESRVIDQLIEGGDRGQVVRLDSYLAALESEIKSVFAQEAAERVRPDLVLQGQYRNNGYGDTSSGSFSKVGETKYPTASIGVSFNWALDWDAKNAVRNSAGADALAARYKKERALRESQTSWSELNRRYQEMSAKVKAAEKLSQVQSAKALAERDKLSKGRSITSNVILAEQDAAEAELTMTKLKAEQRKMEAQGRLFVRLQEVP